MVKRPMINIGKRTIGDGYPVYIIAEIGSNHDGSLEQAKKLIKAAAESGADAVKFQSFSAEGLLNPKKLDENKNWVPHPAYNIIKKLELPDAWHRTLLEYAQARGIDFLSAPFDIKKAKLLNEIGVKAFKIASGDLTYTQLIEYIAKTGKPVILSTGAAYLTEVKQAVDLLKKNGCHQISLLHCVSLYPPKFSDSNIKAMATMKKQFEVPVGYSDHTPGNVIPLGAVALGANIIEKHITFDRNLKGPDHPYALTVEEFKEMVINIRQLESALGNGKKEPARSELLERTGAKRSLYAVESIKKGELITKDKIKVVRHALGLPPARLNSIIGKRSKYDINKDEPIRI